MLAIVLGMLVLELVLACSTTLWDRDEPRFARAAVEMVQTGDYLVPHFNGDLRPDKPILIYWLMSVPIRLIGPTTLAVRLPSVIAMALCAGMVYLLGRRLFGERVSLRAAAYFATMAMPWYIGASATTDAVLLLTILLTMWLFVEAMQRQRGPGWWDFIGMGVTLGLALLTKGPVGVAVPVLAMGGCAAWGLRERKRGATEAWRFPARIWLGLGLSLLISVAIFLAWAVPANNATGGRFAEAGLGKHVVGRMTDAQEGHGGAGLPGYFLMVFYYIPILIAFTFPWVIHLPAGVWSTFGGRTGDARQRAFLIGWFLPTFVLMSLVATKLPHYILPVIPPICLMMASMVESNDEKRLARWDPNWLRGGIWFILPVATLLLVAVGVMAWWTLDRPYVWVELGGVVVIIVMLVMALPAQLKEDTHRTNRVLWWTMPTAMVLLCVGTLRGVEERLKYSPEIVAAVNARVAHDVPVLTCGYVEPSLIFYLNRPASEPIQWVAEAPEQLSQWASEEGPAVLIALGSNIEKAGQLTGKPLLGMELVKRITLVNYARRSQVEEVLVLGRHLPRVSQNHGNPE